MLNFKLVVYIISGRGLFNSCHVEIGSNLSFKEQEQHKTKERKDRMDSTDRKCIYFRFLLFLCYSMSI